MALKPTTRPKVETPKAPEVSDSITTETTEVSDLVTIVTTHNLLEPYTLRRLKAGVEEADVRLTGWVQSQIDAGLAKIVA